MLITAMCEPHNTLGCEQCATPVITTPDDLPPWDPRVNWDEAEEGRPAPDCAAGLWLEASRWRPEHGEPDESGYVIAPACARCVGCGQTLPPYKELIGPVSGSDGEHFHCGNCACYLEED